MGKEEMVEISIANQDGSIRVPISEAQKWEPEKKTILSGCVYFHNGDTFVGMKRSDFEAIYVPKE
jgi:hypothetical protein